MCAEAFAQAARKPSGLPGLGLDQYCICVQHTFAIIGWQAEESPMRATAEKASETRLSARRGSVRRRPSRNVRGSSRSARPPLTARATLAIPTKDPPCSCSSPAANAATPTCLPTPPQPASARSNAPSARPARTGGSGGGVRTAAANSCGARSVLRKSSRLTLRRRPASSSRAPTRCHRHEAALPSTDPGIRGRSRHFGPLTHGFAHGSFDGAGQECLHARTSPSAARPMDLSRLRRDAQSDPARTAVDRNAEELVTCPGRLLVRSDR